MKKTWVFLLLLIFLWSAGVLAQDTSQPMQPSQAAQPSQPTLTIKSLTPGQGAAIQNLTPAQQNVIQTEVNKQGGNITPQVIDTLKNRPESKGVTPEEANKAKTMLEQKKEGTNLATEPLQPAVKAEEGKPMSLFNRFRNIPKYQNIPLDLRPFGFEFFMTAGVRLITDRKDVPVPPKYVVGPGDEIRILLWGRVNAQYDLTVDRDGKITIPQIGPIYVAGQTFEDVSKQVIKQSEQIVGTNVDVTMGALKTIPIFVLGDVVRPGAYTIGSFATITDALLIAGGPNEIGTMRNVQLRRKGKLFTTFDLYDLLLSGDKSQDVQLMAGDVVFVPVTGPLVGIAGNVKRPAIYELRGHSDLKTLIDLAGGLIPTAYTQQIQVERIVRGEKQIVVDIDDKHLQKLPFFTVQDADLVKIFPIVDQDDNAIFLFGNVKRPGKYELKPGLRVGDILKNTDDFLAETHYDYAIIKRLKPPSAEVTVIPFNLGDLIFKKSKEANLELKPKDEIVIFNRWSFLERPYTIVEGEIRGECNADQGAVPETASIDIAAFAAELQTMEDTLRKAGSFDIADRVRELSTELKVNAQTAPQKTKLPASKLFSLRMELHRAGYGDMAARIMGYENRAKAACRVSLVDNMRVRDAILASGGLTTESYLEKAQIVRKDREGKYHTLYFNVDRAIEGDPQHNLPLEKEDKVTIHSLYEMEYRKYVSVAGEIAKPGNYVYTEGMRVKDLIFKGGNILESAYLDEAEVTSLLVDDRTSTRTESRVISLRRALVGDPEHDIPLKPHDRLFVKQIPEWGSLQFINLTGEVRFPGRYAFKKGERLSSVIERAGGYLPTAYLRGAYFTRESVRQLQQKSLEEMANRMERELSAEEASKITSSLTGEEMQAKAVAVQMKRKLIDYIRTVKATGRMTIHLAHVRILKGSVSDVELENGDSLNIPKKNSVINIVGAVMSEGSHLYNERWSYEDYVAAAGGYARYADKGNIFVLKVDGSARKLSRGFLSWNDKKARWEVAGFEDPTTISRLEPGDVIVVPEKLTQVSWLREIRDITQVIMQLAVSAAVIINYQDNND